MRAQRKAPEAIVDTKAALDRLTDDAAKLTARHNELHPGDQWEVKVVPKAAAAPKLSPEVCAALFGQGAEMLGGALGVDSRPTPQAAGEVGKAWSEASRYLPEFDPRWMAFGMAIAATLGACGPMLAERKLRAVGAIPAGVHIPPHAIANGELARPMVAPAPEPRREEAAP